MSGDGSDAEADYGWGDCDDFDEDEPYRRDSWSSLSPANWRSLFASDPSPFRSSYRDIP